MHVATTDFLRTARDPSPRPGVRLLDAIPDWQRAIPAPDLALATRALIAPVVVVRGGSFEPVTTGGARSAVVLDGMLLRNTRVFGRVGTEVLGEGDVIDAAAEIEPSMLSATTEYVVHRPVTLAFLNDRFVAATRRWPSLRAAVDEQVERQRRRASAHLAILQLPRVEDRILAVFTLFADRWGRVTPHGVQIELPLTHELIGRIVGARRPTVTLALATLAEARVLVRGTGGGWLLPRAGVGPPGRA